MCVSVWGWKCPHEHIVQKGKKSRESEKRDEEGGGAEEVRVLHHTELPVHVYKSNIRTGG